MWFYAGIDEEKKKAEWKVQKQTWSYMWTYRVLKVSQINRKDQLFKKLCLSNRPDIWRNIKLGLLLTPKPNQFHVDQKYKLKKVNHDSNR